MPRMAAMWHCAVLDGFIEPLFESVDRSFKGATTLCQDLTVFNVTPDCVTVRQAVTDPAQQAVIGPSTTEPRMEEPFPAPEWFADARLDWQSRLR